MKEIQVIKYKDENIKTPFYLKKCFIAIIILIMIIVLIGFLFFILIAIFNFFTYITTFSYSISKDGIIQINEYLLKIELNLKQSLFTQDLKNISSIISANFTITNSLIPRVEQNLFIDFGIPKQLYTNLTYYDFQIVQAMTAGNFLMAKSLIYSKEYTTIQDTLHSYVTNVTSDINYGLSVINAQNIVFLVLIFVIIIFTIPLLIVGVIFFIVSQCIFLKKIKGLYSTKFKRVNELLLGDTFDNPTIFSKFMDYCKKEHSSENVYFWLDLQKYKKIPIVELETKKKLLLEIHDKYIKKDSDMELNISVDDKDSIFNDLENPTDQIFDKIEHIIRELLLDTHKRFKESYFLNVKN
jgi:hypothetical protein